MSEQLQQDTSIEEAPDPNKCASPEYIGSCIANAIIDLGEKSPYSKQILSLIKQPSIEAYNQARNILGRE